MGILKHLQGRCRARGNEIRRHGRVDESCKAFLAYARRKTTGASASCYHSAYVTTCSRSRAIEAAECPPGPICGVKSDFSCEYIP